VDGGPEGREGVLLGLASGSVIKVFIDNPFPIEITKLAAPVIQLDINIYRTVVACVDEGNSMTITDLRTQEVLFTAPGTVSVSKNDL
jgi:intraflagellar transport protein 122